MSRRIHYWVEYKSKNSNNWVLLNPTNKDKEGNDKQYNNSYFQGWLKDRIMQYSSDCDFINRGFPQDMSEELQLISEPEKYDNNKFNNGHSYVLLSEIKEYLDNSKKYIEKQITKLQQNERLDIINNNIFILAKIVTGTTGSIHELKNFVERDDYNNDEYDAVLEYQEELDDIKYWIDYLDKIMFLVDFLTDEWIVDYSDVRLVYYCN